MLDTVKELINDKYYDYYFPFLYDESGNRKWGSALTSLIMNNENIVEYFRQWQKLASDTGSRSEEWSGSDIETTKNNPKTQTKTFTDNLIKQTETRYSGVGGTSSQSLADVVIDSPTENNNTQIEEVVMKANNDDVKTFTKGTFKTFKDHRTPAEVLAENSNIKSPLMEFVNLFGQVLVNPFYEWELLDLWGAC